MLWLSNIQAQRIVPLHLVHTWWSPDALDVAHVAQDIPKPRSGTTWSRVCLALRGASTCTLLRLKRFGIISWLSSSHQELHGERARSDRFFSIPKALPQAHLESLPTPVWRTLAIDIMLSRVLNAYLSSDLMSTHDFVVKTSRCPCLYWPWCKKLGTTLSAGHQKWLGISFFKTHLNNVGNDVGSWEHTCLFRDSSSHSQPELAQHNGLHEPTAYTLA